MSHQISVPLSHQIGVCHMSHQIGVPLFSSDMFVSPVLSDRCVSLVSLDRCVAFLIALKGVHHLSYQICPSHVSSGSCVTSLVSLIS